MKPLVSAVNEERQRVQGYRFVGRTLTTQFVREFSEGRVRPFLARELLNVPKLPYSPSEFNEVTGGTGNLTEKEHEFLGYLVEWEGTVESFTLDISEITLCLQIGAFPSYYRLKLRLPLSYLDLVKVMSSGQRLRARGVIDNIFLGVITLNYVDPRDRLGERWSLISRCSWPGRHCGLSRLKSIKPARQLIHAHCADRGGQSHASLPHLID